MVKWDAQFKVFTVFSQSPVLSELQDLDWEIWESDSDMVHHALSESGQSPEASTVFLITANVAHVKLIELLKDDGVLAYLMAPSSVSDALIKVVRQKRWINLDGLPGLPKVLKLTQLFDF